jgi:uncharacterized membrane protein
MRRTGWGRLLPLLTLGELVVDKLPATPARTIPPALAARAVGGALAGAAVGRPGNRLAGAALGLAGALGATYAGPLYRKAASRVMPPFLAGLLEDGVAVALALSSTSSTGPCEQ